MGSVNGDRLIQGGGTPESTWRAWPGFARVPSLALDGLKKPGGRLVVIAPHPDDEVLACGGLLSQHALDGGNSLIVAVTDGEASHAGAAGWNRDQLAVARRAESAEGLARLGLRGNEVVRLGLPDGAVGLHIGALSTSLRKIIRPHDVVVSTWRFDGHPDHEAVGHTAANVCAEIDVQLIEAPVWTWHWAEPGDLRIPWHRLRGLALRPATQSRKHKALAAHTTQLTPRGQSEGPVLGESILQRAERPHEYFFV